MAIAVNGTPVGNTGTLVTTLDVVTSVSAGHMIVVVAVCEDETTTNTIAVADSNGNAYSEVISDHVTAGIPRGYMWKTSAASPGAITKVTLTPSTTCNLCAFVLDITGANNSAAAESFKISHGTSTALSSGASVGTPSTGDLAIGFGVWNTATGGAGSADTSPLFAPGNGGGTTGTTNLVENADMFQRVNLRLQALSIAGATAQTFQSTIGNVAWTAGVAMFKGGATVPGAPTIGTATPGTASASVTFSAPGSDGGSSITTYTVTCVSSTGGVTQSNSGASSPIVVSGLTPGKVYTATVVATNTIGDSSASAASNSFIPPYYFRPPRTHTAVRRSGTW